MAREVLQANDPNVSLDDPVAGQTRVTLTSITYVPASDELIVFHNGSALVLGQDYTEEDSTHVVLLFLPDATGPDIDVLEFLTVNVGSSDFVPAPTTFNQVDPPRRPDNFNGRFLFP